MGLLYCYGIIGEKISVALKGFEEKNVYFVSFQGVYAVVSDVSEESFSQEVIDERVKDLSWLSEFGNLHEKVIEEIMKTTTIIPMKFCTIFQHKDGVVAMLREKFVDLQFNLQNLQGMVEMSVKVYYDVGVLRKEVIGGSDELKKMCAAAEKKAGESPGAAYFERKKVGVLVDREIQIVLAEQKERLFEGIQKEGFDARMNKILPKKLVGRDMLLNAVVVITKEDVGFKGRMVKLQEKFGGVVLEVFGPFPPYNFIR
jgi:hypothetical protein